MARMLAKGGKSKKNQGKAATGASLSSTPLFPDMQTLGRGLGSSYAYAVSKWIDEAPNLKGSSNSFLGVNKKILDPLSFESNTLSLQKNPRKK